MKPPEKRKTRNTNQRKRRKGKRYVEILIYKLL
jgi:hypothetical protein